MNIIETMVLWAAGLHSWTQDRKQYRNESGQILGEVILWTGLGVLAVALLAVIVLVVHKYMAQIQGL